MSRKPARDVHEAIAARLRESGQRYTGARRALASALAGSAGPLSAAELLAAIGDLPQSSVYRNLADLEQAGVVVRVAAGGDLARYELAEALAGHHHHLLCVECGSVADVALSAAFERAMDRAVAEAASSVGFSATAHRVDLLGLCERCA